MIPITKLKFWTQRVLPIVFDDSLSFQELLYKVTQKINEVIGVVNDLGGQIQSDVESILREWYDDGTLAEIINETIFNKLNQHILWYTPEDFGAVGDGLTDCTDAFDAACHAMAEGDIRILFIPKGTYLIKYTIAIPEGCTLIGTGPESCIYYDETHTGFGVAITNAGSDVTIANLRFEQARTGRVSFGSQTGCIGISTLAPEKLGKVTAPYDRSENHHIRIINVYSDNSPYILQTEPASDGNGITDVYVEGVYAPKSLVSYLAGTNGGIKKLTYKNIFCDCIRLGNNTKQTKDILLSDFYCKGLRVTDGNHAIVENGIVDCSGDTNNDSTNMCMLLPDTILKNVEFKGGNEQYSYYLSCYGSEGQFIINGCKMSGAARFATQSVSGQACTMPMMINDCDINWTEDHVPNVQGCVVNSSFKDIIPIYPLYFLDKTYNFNVSSFITWSTANINATRFPSSARVTGTKMHVKCMRTFTDLPEDGTLFTIASSRANKLIGSKTIYIPVRLYSSNFEKSFETCAKFDSNGNMKIVTDGLTMSNFTGYAMDADIELDDYHI